MNTHQQVGKFVANFTPFLTDVGRLANACQLKYQTNHCITALSAIWQVGNAANFPTYTTCCFYSIYDHDLIVGNSLPPSGGEKHFVFSPPNRRVCLGSSKVATISEFLS